MTDPRFDQEPEAWMDFANCLGVDPDLMFPERGDSLRPARQVCAGCVVRRTCAQYAIDHREKYGVWGGLSERQRREIRMGRSTVDAELAAIRGRTCSECGEHFPVGVDARNRKVCSDLCATRRNVRMSTERARARRRAVS